MLKKLIAIITNEYHACKLCEGAKEMALENQFPFSKQVEDYIYSNNDGKVFVECPACKGTGIVWGRK